MTMPAGEDGTHVLLGQILAKQGEMGIQLAVVIEQLKSIPDHESRIRALERWRWGLPASVIAAFASGAAAWLAYARH
jgi:hypothetical protein